MTLGNGVHETIMLSPHMSAWDEVDVGACHDNADEVLLRSASMLSSPYSASLVPRANRVPDRMTDTSMASSSKSVTKRASTSATHRENSGLRRNAVKVPCDECIQRASQESNNASIQLCDECMRLLHRPRRRAPQPANIGRIRRRTDAILDTALGLPSTPIPVPWSEDRDVQHALQFFIHHSAPQLAGYFDSPFWQRMLLQSARHSPAVKHAIAAIGTLHENLLMGKDDQDATSQRKTRFALEQCNQSIKHLTEPVEGSKPPDLRLMLTTCVLFTCFEAMQGHCEQAITHAKQGYALLRQYATDPDSNPFEAGTFAVELDQLSLIMQRLQTQSKGLIAKNYTTVGEDSGLGVPKPVYFEDLRDARTAIELVINHQTIYYLDLDLSDDFYELMCASGEKCLMFTEWLEGWEKAFAQLLQRKKDEMTPSERKGAMVLKAHHLVCEILAEVDLSEGELGWDKFRPSFIAILDLAEAVLEDNSQDKAQRAADMSTTPKTQLCFSLGIVDPLYEVCARCRDPLLRRRALHLLARHPTQDCMWSSWSAWKVGKYIMHLEEEKSNTPPLKAGDISAEDRISNAWFDFPEATSGGAGSIGRLMYQRMGVRHSPRSALNPGLFAEQLGDQHSGQDVNFAHAMLGSDFIDAETACTTTVSTDPTFFEPEAGQQSASLSSPDL